LFQAEIRGSSSEDSRSYHGQSESPFCCQVAKELFERKIAIQKRTLPLAVENDRGKRLCDMDVTLKSCETKNQIKATSAERKTP
jgi:hypothetical protein